MHPCDLRVGKIALGLQQEPDFQVVVSADRPSSAGHVLPRGRCRMFWVSAENTEVFACVLEIYFGLVAGVLCHLHIVISHRLAIVGKGAGKYRLGTRSGACPKAVVQTQHRERLPSRARRRVTTRLCQKRRRSGKV